MHPVQITRTLGSHPLTAVMAAVVLLLIASAMPAGAEPGNDNRAPDVGDCEELNVDAGHKVAFHAYAEGVQIYRWNGATWDFVAPEAILFTEGAGIVGIHYGGPTWESASGSKVVGAVLERCPQPGTIPWLKLKAVSSGGPGIFSGVTFIQRVNTVGGTAPAAPGAFVGAEARVPYAADYFFYRKQG